MLSKIARICAVLSLACLAGCEDMSDEDMGNVMQAMQVAANDGGGYNGASPYGAASAGQDPDQALTNAFVQGTVNAAATDGDAGDAFANGMLNSLQNSAGGGTVGMPQQLASNGGMPGGAAGSTPGQPNMAAAYCPGFTEDNYRTRALQGGGDTQLYTLCGGAYEYFHMYQNAIRQGLAGADRTYQAHRASALQIQQFVNQTR
jgi:hypothetical protein